MCRCWPLAGWGPCDDDSERADAGARRPAAHGADAPTATPTAEAAAARAASSRSGSPSRTRTSSGPRARARCRRSSRAGATSSRSCGPRTTGSSSTGRRSSRPRGGRSSTRYNARLHARQAAVRRLRRAARPAAGAGGAPARGRLGGARRAAAARRSGRRGPPAAASATARTPRSRPPRTATGWPRTRRFVERVLAEARDGRRRPALLEPVERAQPPVLHLAAAAGVRPRPRRRRRSRPTSRWRARCKRRWTTAPGRPGARARRAGRARRAPADDDLDRGVRRRASRRTSPAPRAIWTQHGYVGGRDPVDDLERALARKGCERPAIWITETGVGAPRSGEERRTSRASQVRACGRLHRRLARWYGDPRVTAAFQYTFREDDLFPTGLVTTDLAGAYPALGEWMAWGTVARPSRPTRRRRTPARSSHVAARARVGGAMRLYDYAASGNCFKVRLLLGAARAPVRAGAGRHLRRRHADRRLRGDQPAARDAGARARRRRAARAVRRDPLVPRRGHAVAAGRPRSSARRSRSGCRSSRSGSWAGSATRASGCSRAATRPSVEARLATGRDALAVLDAHLAGRDWVVGERADDRRPRAVPVRQRRGRRGRRSGACRRSARGSSASARCRGSSTTS